MVWIKFESELRKHMNETNKKHQLIKYDLTTQKKTEFLDTLAYIDSNKRLQITHLTVKTILMLNQHRFSLKNVSRMIKHSELNAYVQPSSNTGNIPKT